MDNSIPSKEEQILEMFKWLEKNAEALGGCSDGNCVIHKPKGMHTNGGCRCASDRNRIYRYVQYVAYFRNAVRKIRDEN